MSYFLNKEVFSELDFSKYFGKDTTNDLEIKIINNEKILFDFNKFEMGCSVQGIKTEINKIIIDWGDGTYDRLQKPFPKLKTTLGALEEDKWKQIEHLFNVEKRFVYVGGNHTIKITCYNTFGDKKTYKILYKVVYKSVYDIGSDFTIMSANLTNDNLVSYTIRQQASDSVIVVSTKNWKSRFGNKDEIVYVSDDTQSQEFVDQFVDQDSIIWNWNDYPTLIWIDEPNFSDKTNKKIQGKFNSDDIIIESAKVTIKNLTKGNVWASSEVQINKDGDFVFDLQGESNSGLNIYEILVQVTGINGVGGVSQSKYITSEEITDKNVKSGIEFILSPDKYNQTATWKVKKGSGLENNIKYINPILINQAAKKQYVFPNIEPAENEKNLSFCAENCSIPDGDYKIGAKIVLKNGAEYSYNYDTQYTIKNSICGVTSFNLDGDTISWELDVDKNSNYVFENVQFDFKIDSQKSLNCVKYYPNKTNERSFKHTFDGTLIADGKYTFTIKNIKKYLYQHGYCESGEKSEELTFKFVTPKLQLHTAELRVKKTNYQGKQMVVPYFFYRMTSNSISFENLKNPSLKIYNDSFDTRTVNLNNVNGYVVKDDGKELKPIKDVDVDGKIDKDGYLFFNDNDTSWLPSKQNTNYDYNRCIFCFSGYDEKDKIYKRLGKDFSDNDRIFKNDIVSIIQESVKESKPFYIPQNTVFTQIDVNGAQITYTDEDNVERVSTTTWGQVKEKTVDNIKKDYYCTIGGNSYYCYNEGKYIEVHQKNKKDEVGLSKDGMNNWITNAIADSKKGNNLLFVHSMGYIQRRYKYVDAQGVEKKIVRYQPKIFVQVQKKGDTYNKAEQKTLEPFTKLIEYFKYTNVKYNKSVDGFDLDFEVKFNQNVNEQDIKQSKIQIKNTSRKSEVLSKSENNTYKTSIYGINLPISQELKYTAILTGDTTKNKTSNDQKTCEVSDLKISTDDAIQLITARRLSNSQGKETNKIKFSWKLNHKNCNFATFYYKKGDSEEVDVDAKSYDTCEISYEGVVSYWFEIDSDYDVQGIKEIGTDNTVTYTKIHKGEIGAKRSATTETATYIIA